MAAPANRLAIDLSGGAIRIVEGTPGGTMRCGSAAPPDGALTGGKITDAPAVGRTLRALLARTEIVLTRGLVAASDTVATFRILRLAAASTTREIDAAIAKDLPFDPERMATRWTEVSKVGGERVVYAVAWDRARVRNLTEAVKLAGIEPTVVELKSASVTRVVSAPSCLLVDLTVAPAEIVLIDDHLPQLWHSFAVEDPLSGAAASTIAAALRTVLRHYRRRTDERSLQTAPIFISGEQAIAQQVLEDVAERVGQPVLPLAAPERVPADVRHSTYLACLGLLMRRG